METNSPYLLQYILTLAKNHLFYFGLYFAITPSYLAGGCFHPYILCESYFCYYDEMAVCGLHIKK